MKIICENCSAKYSIADEKVQGKVFKIRCKKCGESIVVRGDSHQASEPAAQPSSQTQPSGEQMPAEDPPPMPDEPGEEDGDAETRVFDYSGYQSSGQDPAIWHIVVDGQQQGPYTGGQIRQFLDTGSLDAESFIWKEGFDDWMPIKNVPELGWAGGTRPRAEIPTEQPSGAGLFDSPAPSGGGLFDQPAAGGLFGQEPGAVANAASPFDSGAGLFGGEAGGPGSAGDSSGDVFSSTSPAPTGGMFNADTTMEPESAGIFGDAGGGGQDLFGDMGDKGGGDGLFGASGGGESPRVSAAQAMTGQRSENSVLFSLSNLQALAASPAAGDAGGSVGGGGGGGMFGSSSGGIAPAAAPAAVPGEEASGLIDIRSLAGSLSAEKDNTGVDDLISMGGGGFAPSLGAPVLAPQNTGLSLPLKIAIGGGGVIVLVIIVVLIVMVVQGNSSDSGQQLAEAQLIELKKQLGEMRASGGSTGQIESIQTQIAQKEQENGKTRVAATVAQNMSDEKQQTPEAKESSGSAKARTSSGKRSAAAGRSASSGSSASSAKGKTTSSSSGSRSGSSSPASGSGTTPKKRGGADELDDLLGGSLSKPKKAAPAAAPAASTGKKTLDRSDVQKGMNSVQGRVKACSQGQSGTVTLKVVIGRTGRVMSATPKGPFAGTPVGACAARAVRSAKFPVSDASLTVTYPFRF